eukprot:2012623-Prymnesium_polylepis.1
MGAAPPQQPGTLALHLETVSDQRLLKTSHASNTEFHSCPMLQTFCPMIPTPKGSLFTPVYFIATHP